MIYQVDKIVQDVRVCLDQNDVDTPMALAGDPNTLMLDDLIKSNIVKAVEQVGKAAPYWLCEQGHNFDNGADAICWEDMESGWVLLPDDYMRLVVFEMSDWERPVYNAISTTDKAYKRCRSRVKSLRGTAQRPVCAVVVKPAGRALEFYSCKSEEATITKAVYLPYPVIEADGGVDISEKLYEAAVYQTAALTMSACGDADRAKLLFSLSSQQLAVSGQ